MLISGICNGHRPAVYADLLPEAALQSCMGVVLQPNSKSDAQGNSQPYACSYSSPNSKPSVISPCPVNAGVQRRAISACILI